MTPGGPAGGGSGTIATGAVDAPTEPAPMIATIRSDGSTASCPLLRGSDAAGSGIDEASIDGGRVTAAWLGMGVGRGL
jgi:hypothetical protein